METEYRYFNRDISWLSFNYRVLLEANDEKLPLYERIKFISIYSSNLEEFYKVRVAEHQAVINGQGYCPEEVALARKTLEEITAEVNRQLEERVAIYERKIVPALEQNGIVFYQNSAVREVHVAYIRNFFREEIFPYLQPVLVKCDETLTFLRDNRLYLVVRMYKKEEQPGEVPGEPAYFVLKLPYSKVPRFIELPPDGGKYYVMFIEDIIKANINMMFPGYRMDGAYCIKTSRDADILIDDAIFGNIVEQVKKRVKKRKTGAICRFVYDREMPACFLDYLIRAFKIDRKELVAGDKHLNLEDLAHFPDPTGRMRQDHGLVPMKLRILDKKESVFKYIHKRDLLIHFPYHSFEHFIHFLYEAVHDPFTREIMLTQYRVAQNSAVINTLIAAARNGKKVTVFVELKARFDEEHNLATAQMMEEAGIHIIYSIPGLKVHAKVALVLRRDAKGIPVKSYGYISTGNFNEKTARLYADTGLFTGNEGVVEDLHNLFRHLRKEAAPPGFNHLLVTRFNLLTVLEKQIDEEIGYARQGKGGRIILKMNALQEKSMIDKLYEASLAGVKIDLIIRGICCLIPGEVFSRNIRITRIVDTFLEHTRIWYFGGGGSPKVYLGSPDWMRRNLFRRIEVVTPVYDEKLKREITAMLTIQLTDNRKACFVNNQLENIFKNDPGKEEIRCQYYFYRYLKNKNETGL